MIQRHVVHTRKRNICNPQTVARTERAEHLEASGAELELLKLKATQKIHDFLFAKIMALKRPKTNLQILQQNVLVG